VKLNTHKAKNSFDIWNLREPDPPVMLIECLVQSINATGLTGSAPSRGKLTFTATGNFSFNGTPKTWADVTGTFLSLNVFYDGVFGEVQTWSDGIDIQRFWDHAYVTSQMATNDYFEGSSTFGGNDKLQGLGGDDSFKGYGDSGSVGGNGDYFFGGSGIDTSIYRGKSSEYIFTRSNTILDGRKTDGSTVSGVVVTDLVNARDGTDSLVEVENLTFSNVTLPTSIDLFFATKGTAVAARGAVDMASAIATQLSVVYLGRPADKTLLLELKTALGNEQPSAAVLSLIAAKAIQDGAFASSNSSKDIVVNTFNNIMGFLPSAFEQTAWANYIDNGTLTKANAPWIIFQSYLGANNVPDVYKLPTQARFVAAQTFSDYAFLDTQQAGLASLNSIYANAARKWLAPVGSVSHAASKMQTMIADVESVTLTGVAPVDSFVG
jgi:hypothetical protein